MFHENIEAEATVGKSSVKVLVWNFSKFATYTEYDLCHEFFRDFPKKFRSVMSNSNHILMQWVTLEEKDGSLKDLTGSVVIHNIFQFRTFWKLQMWNSAKLAFNPVLFWVWKISNIKTALHVLSKQNHKKKKKNRSLQKIVAITYIYYPIPLKCCIYS